MSAGAITCSKCGEAQLPGARFCTICGAPAATEAVATTDALLGQVIADRFRLVEKLGQGKAGTVYRAEHVGLGKQVAVKILHAHLCQDEKAVERFRREATTVSQIENQHIVEVHDFGRLDGKADGRLFFAMELLEGESLSDRIARERELPIAEVVDIMTQVAETLMEAHGLGYVHRDLRPRNIFLVAKKDRSDYVKLLDFGLSKLLEPNVETKQTAIGMAFGDQRYLSPEQLRGDALDRRTDLYSLGIVTYEALSGAPPFRGTLAEIMNSQLDQVPPPVSQMRSDCPGWLSEIVARLLQKKAEDRFVTALRLNEALQAGASQAMAVTGPVPRAESPQPTAAAEVAPSAMVSSGKGKRRRKGTTNPPVVATTTGEMVASNGVAHADPASTVMGMPSVVVDNPARNSDDHTPLPKPVALVENRREVSGEWFADTGKFQAELLEKTYSSYEEEERLAARRRQWYVIGGIVGGVGLVGVASILILLHHASPPLTETATAATAKGATDSPTPTPTPTVPAAAKTPAIAPVAVPPKVASVTPAEPRLDHPAAPVPMPRAEPKKIESKLAPTPEPRKVEPRVSAEPKRSELKKIEPPKPAKKSEEVKQAKTTDKGAGDGKAQAQALVKVGRERLAASDFSQAQGHFSQAQKLDPRNADAMAGLGEVAFEQGEYQAAASHLQKAVRLSNRSRYLVLLGQAYYKQGRIKESISEYKKALHVDPRNQEAEHSLAIAERKLQGG